MGVAMLVAEPNTAEPNTAEPVIGPEAAERLAQLGVTRVADGTFTSCESYGPVPGDSIGPAWNGLETAHHGPDSGDPGTAEDCYKADGSLPPV